MAPVTVNQGINSLRMVTQRLSSVSPTQLPHIATFLAGSITESREAFAKHDHGSNIRSEQDTNMIIHKLKAQLSALLQGKGPHARLSALILIKATVEAGGWSVLQGVAPWVRGMISMLGVSHRTIRPKMHFKFWNIFLHEIYRLHSSNLTTETRFSSN